ncbi:MAG: GAF domain-containing protein [Candidatus Omnitrophica bacterium]|nr:GAF domain-containing protein [Candidatus Omnitrophota bacterium]
MDMRIRKEYENILINILNHNDFESSARVVFESCKKLTGATAGYVALLSEDGSENKVLFLDDGGRECTVDQNLPMPIRGLRSESYKHKKAVYDNDFHNSEWMKFMPKGHVRLDNVMFAPLIIDDKAVGLIGVSNKDGDFTDKDAEVATTLGTLAAIALKNSMKVKEIKEKEEKLNMKVEELMKSNKCMMGREKKILELKKKINELYEQIGKEPPYLSAK